MGIGWESVPLERCATRSGEPHFNAGGLHAIINRKRLYVRTLSLDSKRNSRETRTRRKNLLSHERLGGRCWGGETLTNKTNRRHGSFVKFFGHRST